MKLEKWCVCRYIFYAMIFVDTKMVDIRKGRSTEYVLAKFLEEFGSMWFVVKHPVMFHNG